MARRPRKARRRKTIPAVAWGWRTSSNTRSLSESCSLSGLRYSHANVQLAQLQLAGLGRRIRHRIRRRLRLREGDHLADAVGTGHQHRQAVQAERNAAVRRRTELERIQQEAKLLL